MNDRNYIQYHNADQLGSYPGRDLDFSLSVNSLNLDSTIKFATWIYTKKKNVEKAIGGSCFLIVGKREKIL